MKEIYKSKDRIISTQRLGGYYKWSWKYPFRVFVKERILVATEKSIYEIYQ